MIENHGTFTFDIHVVSKGQKKFLERILYINQNERRPISCIDFSDLTRTNYRKLIQKSKKYLELVSNGRPKFWKIKGIELAGDSHKITFRGTGVAPEFDHLLESLRDQPPMIHDIHLKFESDLHSKLVYMRYSVNPNNHAIENIRYTSLDNDINTKILVYPKTTQIVIGCTYKPIVYDISGIHSLFSHISQIQYYLSQLVKYEITIPEAKTWMVTRYDFNKDGSTSVCRDSFCYQFEDVSTGLIRFYLKTMPNGETIPRLEQIRIPNKSVSQILEEIIQNESNI